MSDNFWQIILKVGCEGGSISLHGKKEKSNWIFTMTTDESSLKRLISKEDQLGELKSKSQVAYSWEGALSLLNQYPHWPELSPVIAHHDFVEQIIEAVRDRDIANTKNESNIGSVDWANWINAFIETSTKPSTPILNSNSQIVGNIGMYWVSYHLSKLGWNVMPTSRNARGVDVIVYDDNSVNYLGIQVKTLSKRNPVPLGNSLDKIIGNYWVIVILTGGNPVAYVLTPDEVKYAAHKGEKDGKISYWLQPKSYDIEYFKEAWHRMN